MHVATIHYFSPLQNTTHMAYPFEKQKGIFNHVISTNIEFAIKQANKIEKCRSDNLGKYVSSIFENVGFKRIKAKILSKILTPYLTGEKDIKVIERTSSLGKILTEFGHRQKAFKTIHQYKESVSDQILEDVSYPVSTQLRKEAMREVLALTSGKMKSDQSSINQEHDSVFQTMREGFYSLGSRLLSVARYIDSNMLHFPAAYAESVPTHFDPCKNGLFSKACMQILTPEKLEEMKEHMESQIEKLKDKNCLRLLGYSGSGKSSFCNYLYSTNCSRKHEGLKCKPPVADVGGGNVAVTQLIQTYPISEFPKLIKDTLVEDSAIVDFPGFLGRGENKLVNLVHSIFAVKSMANVTEVARSIVDVIMIEYDSFLALHGDLEDLIGTLDLKQEKPNGLIIITKLPRPPYFGQYHSAPLPNKESLIEFLKNKGIHPRLADTTILYDPLDEDLALSPSQFSKGGSNKAEILKTIANMQRQESAKQFKQSESNQLFTTRQLNQYIEQLKITLEDAISATGDVSAKHELAEKFMNFQSMVGYLPLNEMTRQTIEAANVANIQTTSIEKFQTMLETGNPEPFLKHLNEQLITSRDNPLIKDRFNSTFQLESYISRIIGTDVNNNLKDSLVFTEIAKYYPSFLSDLEKRVRNDIERLINDLHRNLTTCGDFIDVKTEHRKLRTLSSVIQLNINEDNFDIIERLSNQLELVQKYYPNEREIVIDNYLGMAIRDPLIMIFSLAILYNFLPFQLRIRTARNGASQQAQQIEQLKQRLQYVEKIATGIIITNLLSMFSNFSLFEKLMMGATTYYVYNVTTINYLRSLGIVVSLLEKFVGEQMNQEACIAARGKAMA